VTKRTEVQDRIIIRPSLYRGRIVAPHSSVYLSVHPVPAYDLLEIGMP